MSQLELNQGLKTKLISDDLIFSWMESFIVDREIQNFSKGTIKFYITKLKVFLDFCERNDVLYINQITPVLIRQYLKELEDNGHNPGGIHCFYRSLKTFLIWWGNETEPEGWRNPILKVKGPKLTIEPLEPVSFEVIEKLIGTCKGSHLLTLRDRAILLLLLDTGARAAEICSLNLNDVDLITGSCLIRQGKGRKPRMVFLENTARKVLRKYVKARNEREELNTQEALWVTKQGDRLEYWGLNEILRRRSKMANVEKPGLHDFRRAFALNYLRNGGRPQTLQRLMGHADMQVLNRYLALTVDDLQKDHHLFSPVEHSRLKNLCS